MTKNAVQKFPKSTTALQTDDRQTDDRLTDDYTRPGDRQQTANVNVTLKTADYTK